MAITRTTWIDDNGSGTTGSIINNAWLQSLYDQINGVVGDPWTAVPFAAANFAGVAPLTWTVGAGAVFRNRYAVIGKLMIWSFYLSWFSGGNVLGGSAGPALRMTIPGGYSSTGQQQQIIDYCAVAGAAAVGGLYATVNAGSIDINKSTGSNFATSDVPGMITTILLEVN